MLYTKSTLYRTNNAVKYHEQSLILINHRISQVMLLGSEVFKHRSPCIIWFFHNWVPSSFNARKVFMSWVWVTNSFNRVVGNYMLQVYVLSELQVLPWDTNNTSVASQTSGGTPKTINNTLYWRIKLWGSQGKSSVISSFEEKGFIFSCQ